jgi:hypothetical protein
VPIRNLHRVRRVLSDGRSNYHFYHRPTGTRLPPPDSPDFQKAYDAAERRYAERTTTQRPIDSTIPIVPNIEPIERPNGKAHLNREFSVSDSRYLTPEEVSVRYRGEITVGTLANWRAMKIGPPYLKIGKAILYPVSALDEWEQRNLVLCGLQDL